VACKAVLQRALLDRHLELRFFRLRPPGAIVDLRTVRINPHGLFLGLAPGRAERIVGSLHVSRVLACDDLGPVAP